MQASDSTTSFAGTVIVLTTPDANRTFLSYLGTPQAVQLDSAVSDAVCCSRVVAVEGYIWETPSAVDKIQKVGRFHTCYSLSHEYTSINDSASMKGSP